MESRDTLISELLKHFLSDLEKSLIPFQNSDELIYLAESLKEYLLGIYNTRPASDLFDEINFDEDEFLRTKLLSKFRDKMRPFVALSVRDYFAKDEYGQKRLLQKLNIEQPVLTYWEYDSYINSIYHFITTWLEKLYLQAPGSDTKTAELPKLPEPTEQQDKHPDYSRSRQLLLFYFLAQSIGIDRGTVSMRDLAKFAHYLFNYPNSNIDNSEVYKQLKKAPYIKADFYLLKDLEFVKSQFVAIGYAPGAALVEKEIRSMKQK